MSNIRKLSPKLAKKAEDELNEDENRIENDLVYIKEWIMKQPHLKARIDDQWLLAFLRKNKYSLEATKVQIDLFYTLRKMIPEFFSNRDPCAKPLSDLISKGAFIPLENRSDQTGPVYWFYHIDKDDVLHDINDLLKYNFMLSDILLNENDNFTVSGLIVICNLENITFSHMSQMTPAIAKKCSTTFFDAYPINLLTVHFINIPNGFMAVYDLLKMFLPIKYREQFYIHKDTSELYDFVPQINLPKDYGGEAKSIAELASEWQKKIESYREWFLDDDRYGCDENLRPGKPKTNDLMFGIDGSFRQLSID